MIRDEIYDNESKRCVIISGIVLCIVACSIIHLIEMEKISCCGIISDNNGNFCPENDVNYWIDEMQSYSDLEYTVYVTNGNVFCYGSWGRKCNIDDIVYLNETNSSTTILSECLYDGGYNVNDICSEKILNKYTNELLHLDRESDFILFKWLYFGESLIVLYILLIYLFGDMGYFNNFICCYTQYMILYRGLWFGLIILYLKYLHLYGMNNHLIQHIMKEIHMM